MALRYQNTNRTYDRVPSYYANNKLYKGSYSRTEYPARTSRRLHEGLSVALNYGLDTDSDQVNESIYSSPYYINGRFNTPNEETQRGSSSSVQGTKRLLTVHDEIDDFTESDIQTTLTMWQGKQIRFSIPYSGKIVGNTLTLKNTDGSTGILSIYLSASKDGPVLYETAVDLCSVSQDNFEHITLYGMTPVPKLANPRGKIYVRMEMWDEVSCERSVNPFNTGKTIEIAATGKGNHEECVYQLPEKNVPANMTYEYAPQPSQPCIGLIYNAWHSIPTNRQQGVQLGATVNGNGYEYDVFCINNGVESEMIIYDRKSNTTIPNTITVDSRATEIHLVQAADEVYYVDGYSPLQKFTVGKWDTYQFPVSETSDVVVSIDLDTWVASGIATDSGTFAFIYNGTDWEYSGKVVQLSTYGITLTGTPAPSGKITVVYVAAGDTTEASVDAEYNDTRPINGASLITLHNNRIYLAGFRGDPNLVQFSEINAQGPDFDSYPYRFYAPNESPYANTNNPITAMTTYQEDVLMFSMKKGYTLFTTNADVEGGYPQQVSTYSDESGTASSGDIVNYRGIIYNFDPDEGFRRFTGALWYKIGNNISNLFERVDMTKPRKLWGYAGYLYLNYTDSVDGKAKCIVYNTGMALSQFPYFQDVDLPFCDARANDDFDIIGIHPDFPCIMKLYDKGTWKRLDTPIEFRRDTKYLYIPGNSSDMILRRVHIKTLANATRWWWVQLNYDRDTLEQVKGNEPWYRVPVWDTIDLDVQVEDPFPDLDNYQDKSVALSSLGYINTRAISVQVCVRCKTFRKQASLLSVLLEARARPYN